KLQHSDLATAQPHLHLHAGYQPLDRQCLLPGVHRLGCAGAGLPGLAGHRPVRPGVLVQTPAARVLSGQLVRDGATLSAEGGPRHLRVFFCSPRCMPFSTQIAPPASDSLPTHAVSDGRWSVASIYLVVLAALVAVYIPVLIGLGYDWAHNPNYSHGFIIPFAVAFVVWQQRDRLRHIPARPSHWGLAPEVLAEAQYLVGFLGAEYFLQRTSLLLLIAGALVYLSGWQLLRTQLFSLTLLLLAIPLPAIIFNSIAFPLQLLASSWAAFLLNLCSIPVYRSGNILMLPQRT